MLVHLYNLTIQLLEGPNSPAAGLSYLAMPTRIWTIFVSLKSCDLKLFQTADWFTKKSGPRLTPPRLLLPSL